jgi:formylglycine-generating enzyme required for sulfatase activity
VGLPVGSRELVRLHHVFALEPGLGQERAEEDQLRDLLASALVHGPGERELFEQVWEPWAERWGEWERSVRPVVEPTPSPVAADQVGQATPIVERSRRRWRPSWRVSLRLLAAAGLAILVLPLAEFPAVDVQSPQPGMPAALDKAAGTAAASVIREVPELTVLARYKSADLQSRILWPPLGLGALALLAAAGLGWRYRRRPWLPEPLPEPEPGPATLPLLPLAAAGPQLLDADGAMTLVWGVGRHVSEQLATELDLEATARETARCGGLPELRYEPEKQLREVWLWLDGTVDDPAMERWAEEVAASLSAAGLPVRIGGFDGYPRELLWDEGQVFRPQEVEAHRQTALVAVCTDGAVLARRLEDERAGEARRLLRALAAWPRLAFVDFSTAGDGALVEVLRSSGPPLVTPEDLPKFFGLGAFPAGGRAEVDPGELRAWRAALALGGRPVDRATAHAVRRELGLEVSPWTFHLLSAGGADNPTVADNHGGGLAWREEGRLALVAWLAEGSFADPTGIREGSLLERAIDFWQRRLAGEAEERERRRELDPWKAHLAERHLAMERALLKLWREPEAAAERLFELRAGELGEEIARRLGRLTPRDGGADLVRLPWRLKDLRTERAKFLLAKLGLGGLKAGDQRHPGRLGLGLGLLASLGAGLLVAGLVGTRAVTDRRLAVPPGSEERTPGELDEPGAPTRPAAFVRLDGGTFRMGSEEGDRLAFDGEKPAHEVTVGDFWIGDTEVTNLHYSRYEPDHPGYSDLPAVNVSWIDAREYCTSLGSADSTYEYDLPTEAEWEYAARAGTTTAWSFGDNEAQLGDYAWFSGNFDGRAHEVGTKKPNPWGLYDMHGNVYEWVLDCWDENAYRKRASDKPIPDPGLGRDTCHERDTAPSARRVLRGGAYWNEPRVLRSAYRASVRPMNRDQNIGFRCVGRPRRQLDPSAP